MAGSSRSRVMGPCRYFPAQWRQSAARSRSSVSADCHPRSRCALASTLATCRGHAQCHRRCGQHRVAHRVVRDRGQCPCIRRGLRPGSQPARAGLRDARQFKLKNVSRPFEVFAVAHDDVALPSAAVIEGKGERLRSLPASLPQPATPIIGRDADVAAIGALLEQRRVVTITGPGGVGKTRLAVEVGHHLPTRFEDGVAFVPLARVTASRTWFPLWPRRWTSRKPRAGPQRTVSQLSSATCVSCSFSTTWSK